MLPLLRGSLQLWGLARRWPAIDGVWLFGSSIDGRFGMASDSDLAVEGLPTLDLLEAMAAAESNAADIRRSFPAETG